MMRMHKKEYGEISGNIIVKYNAVAEKFVFANNHSCEHLSFINTIFAVSQERAECKISNDGKIVIQKGSGTMEDARQRLTQLADLLEKIPEEITDIVDNRTIAREVMLYCDKDEHIHDLVQVFDKLRNAERVVRQATTLEARDAQHIHPDWQKKVALLAKEFWQETFGKKGTCSFHTTPSTLPKNDFSKWFCIVMRSISNPQIPQETCKSLLSGRTKKFDSLIESNYPE
jgi:hypothetical protein